MAKSSYENLSKFLNYRTSNMGMITLTNELLQDKNIFSYINTDGIQINNNIADINNISDISYIKNPTNTNDKEDIIMKTLIFNDTLLNNNDISQKACQHIIRSGTEPNNGYTIGDFSDNITNNITFYTDGFNKISQEQDIDLNNCIDIDLSYYASQDVIKSMFLIDILSQIYGEIARNKDNRESILNNLRNLTIKSRYFIDTNNVWMLCPTYNITFSEKLYPQDRDPKTGNIKPDQISVIEIKDVSVDNEFYKTKINKDIVNTMITLFKSVIKKHIDFIIIADMIYSDSYSNFYKLCRFMLNTVILNSISIIVDNNSKETLYNYDTSFTVHMKNESVCNYLINGKDMLIDKSYFDSDFFYKNYLKFLIGKDATCTNKYKMTYIIKKGSPNNIETGLADFNFNNISDTKSNIELSNSEGKITDVLGDQFLETQDTNLTIIGAFKSDNSINESVLPFAINIEYSQTDNSNKLKLNIDEANKLYEISGLISNNIYYIKLYNFNSLDSNNFIIENDNIYIEWINDIKLLIIFSKKVENVYKMIDNDYSKGKLYLCHIDTNAKTLTIPTDLSSNTEISIHLPACTDIKLGVNDITLNENKLLKINGNTQSYELSYTTNYNCNKFIYNKDSVIKPKYLRISYHSIEYAVNYIFLYNKSKSNINDRILNNFTIPKNDKSLISPLSYEKTSLIDKNRNDTSILRGLYNTENAILDLLLKNITEKISNNFTQDTKDNDAIIKSMGNLATINKNLSKSSTVIKKNYNESTLESSKVLSTSGLFIACAIILVITVFASVYLPISDVSRTNAISISGFIFILAIVMYIIIKLLEKTRYDSYEESFINYSSYKGKINVILNNILSNLYNERTRISQQVIKPSIQKEENYFSEKNKKFEIYKGRTYSDLQIITRIRQKNIAKIDCMLEISIIISLALLLYILKPEWFNILLGVSIILIFISIFILFVKLTYVVQTNAKNKYWTKPDTSLDNLKFSNGLN